MEKKPDTATPLYMPPRDANGGGGAAGTGGEAASFEEWLNNQIDTIEDDVERALDQGLLRYAAGVQQRVNVLLDVRQAYSRFSASLKNRVEAAEGGATSQHTTASAEWIRDSRRHSEGGGGC